MRHEHSGGAGSFQDLMPQFVTLGLEVFFIVGIGVDLDRNGLHDLQSIPEQPGAFPGIVADEP
jgi:hypothetical protein